MTTYEKIANSLSNDIYVLWCDGFIVECYDNGFVLMDDDEEINVNSCIKENELSFYKVTEQSLWEYEDLEEFIKIKKKVLKSVDKIQHHPNQLVLFRIGDCVPITEEGVKDYTTTISDVRESMCNDGLVLHLEKIP